ncbi:MAG: hypothetical protein SGPRY_009052 [Prymnesium sp.]
MTVAAAAAASELLLVLEERSKESEKEWMCARGEMDRLGCELEEARREVTGALEREQQVRQKADDAAEIAASAQQVEAVAQVSERLQKGTSAAARRAALMEAARATEMAKEARTSMGQLQDRMHAQEAAAAEALDHALKLKARMARRAPSESEEDEADLALKRMRSMPTWKPVRGNGAGSGRANMEGNSPDHLLTTSNAGSSSFGRHGDSGDRQAHCPLASTCSTNLRDSEEVQL